MRQRVGFVFQSFNLFPHLTVLDNVCLAPRHLLKLSDKEPKGANLVKVKATIRDVAYYGDTSHIVADIADGKELEINVQNDSRTGGSGVERGQKLWVHFNPHDALLLTE